MYLRGRRPRRRRRRRMAACSRPIRSWRATWVRGQAQLIQLCLRIGYALQELSLAVFFVLYLALLSAADGGSWACLRAWSAGWTDTSQYSWEMGGWCVGNQPHRGSGSCSGARTFNLHCAPQFSSILVGGKREMIIYRNFIWSLRFLQNV